jgi:hypothetical protein
MHGTTTTKINYFDVCTMHVVQFITQHNKCTTNMYTVSTPTCFNASVSSSGSHISILLQVKKVKKAKQSRNRAGVAQRVPGGLGYQISVTFGTWRWWGRQPQASAAFTPGKYSWYSFSLGAESAPGPWYGRREICHWKIQWHHRESIPGPFD